MRRVTWSVSLRPAWRVSRRIRSSERSHLFSSAGGAVSGAGAAAGASVAGGGVAAGSDAVDGAGAGSVDVAAGLVPSCVAAGVDVFSSLFCSEQPETNAASAEIAKMVAVFAIGFICSLPYFLCTRAPDKCPDTPSAGPRAHFGQPRVEKLVAGRQLGLQNIAQTLRYPDDKQQHTTFASGASKAGGVLINFEINHLSSGNWP